MVESGKASSSKDKVAKVVKDDLDTELDIEVEAGEDLALDELETDLDVAEEDLDMEGLAGDLEEDFEDDDFAEELEEEGDDELDLTEDLSKELGPEKYFRDTENNIEDDEEELPRSW